MTEKYRPQRLDEMVGDPEFLNHCLYVDSELTEIVDESGGDIRQAIILCQSRGRSVKKPPEEVKKRIEIKPNMPLKLLHWDPEVPERYHSKDLTLPIEEPLKIVSCNCDKIRRPHYAVRMVHRRGNPPPSLGSRRN